MLHLGWLSQVAHDIRCLHWLRQQRLTVVNRIEIQVNESRKQLELSVVTESANKVTHLALSQLVRVMPVFGVAGQHVNWNLGDHAQTSAELLARYYNLLLAGDTDFVEWHILYTVSGVVKDVKDFHVFD